MDGKVLNYSSEVSDPPGLDAGPQTGDPSCTRTDSYEEVPWCLCRFAADAICFKSNNIRVLFDLNRQRTTLALRPQAFRVRPGGNYYYVVCS